MDLIQSGSLVGEAKDAALSELLRGVIPPYLVLAVVLSIFAVLFYKSGIQDINPSKDEKSHDCGRSSIFAYPYLVLGVLALFCHLGCQALSVNTIMGFAGGLESVHPEIFPSCTLACTLLGYLLGVILIPRRLTQQQTLKICTVLGLVLSILVMILPAKAAIWCLVFMGIPNSVIYAGIWPLAIHDLGKWTNLGSAIMVMALCASAVFPLIYAAIADTTGSLHTAYWILIPGFLYMIYYAFHGHKIERWKRQQ